MLRPTRVRTTYPAATRSATAFCTVRSVTPTRPAISRCVAVGLAANATKTSPCVLRKLQSSGICLRLRREPSAKFPSRTQLRTESYRGSSSSRPRLVAGGHGAPASMEDAYGADRTRFEPTRLRQRRWPRTGNSAPPAPRRRSALPVGEDQNDSCVATLGDGPPALRWWPIRQRTTGRPFAVPWKTAERRPLGQRQRPAERQYGSEVCGTTGRRAYSPRT